MLKGKLSSFNCLIYLSKLLLIQNSFVDMLLLGILFLASFYTCLYKVSCYVLILQAVDGQHLILHPLSMKCLLNHYGHSDKLPSRFGNF